MAQVSATNPPVTTLQSIAICAERISKVSAVLEEFGERFYGQSAVAGDTAALPHATGYKNDLERLWNAIDALEIRASRVCEIG